MKYLQEIKYGSGNMMSTPPPPPPPPGPGPGPSAPPTNQMQQDYENDLRMDELEDEINAIDEEIDNLNDLFKPGIRDTWSRTPEELDLYKQQMSEEMFNLIDIRAKLESEWRHRQRFGYGIYSGGSCCGGMMMPPGAPPPPPPPGGLDPSKLALHQAEELTPLQSVINALKYSQQNLKNKENAMEKYGDPKTQELLDRAKNVFDREIKRTFELINFPLTPEIYNQIKNASGKFEVEFIVKKYVVVEPTSFAPALRFPPPPPPALRPPPLPALRPPLLQPPPPPRLPPPRPPLPLALQGPPPVPQNALNLFHPPQYGLAPQRPTSSSQDSDDIFQQLLKKFKPN
jgi:hypothetical protein